MKHRHFSKKCICLFLLSALVLLGACSTDSLDVVAPEDSEEEVIGQSIGQELVASYAADRVFSVNCMREESFDPYATPSNWNRMVSMLVYENMLESESDFTVSPNLITGWSTDDGTNWYFSVDTTRLFHDGTPLSASDCVYSLNRARSSDMYSRRFASVAAAWAEDEGTFIVSLDEPNRQFYKLLTIPCIQQSTGDSYHPGGTGPYYFNSTGRMLMLSKSWPLYNQMPLKVIYLKQYTAAEDILQAFEDSYIDIVINDPTAMSTLGYSSANIIKYVDTLNLHYLGYNMNSTMFGQTVYRAMMTYAIDRSSIVSDCLEGAGVAASLPVHPLSPMYPTEYAETLNYSDGSFQIAVRNTGAADVTGDGILEIYSGPSAIEYTINFVVCSESEAKVTAARKIAQQLEDVGFSVNLRELSYDDYLQALENGDFDIYYAETRLTQDWNLSALFDANGALNYGGVKDDYLANYLQSYLTADAAAEQDAFLALMQYIGQSCPITAICFERSEILYHRGVISNASPHQDNLFYDFSNWTICLDSD